MLFTNILILCFAFRYTLSFVWPFDDHTPRHTTVIRVLKVAADYLDLEIPGQRNVSIITVTTHNVTQDALPTLAFVVLTTAAMKTGLWVKTTSLTPFLPATRNGL